MPAARASGLEVHFHGSLTPKADAAELERCITKLGFQGVLFNGYAQQGRDDNLVYLDHPSYTPLWETALSAVGRPECGQHWLGRQTTCVQNGPATVDDRRPRAIRHATGPTHRDR